MPMKKGNKEKKVYFSPREWEIVCRHSEKLGMRTGTYIRTISVQGSIKVFNLKELTDVYKAMNRIGVNINQISTVANSTKSIYQRGIEDLQEEIKQLRLVVEDWLSPLQSEELL